MNTQRCSALLAAVALSVATAPLSSQVPAPANRRADFERLAKAALAQHQGTIIARGVHEPVEVLRDQHGIPHIYAKNTNDLFFAQGFTVAQDRMWQLELWRRNGEGKLAEVLGPRLRDARPLRAPARLPRQLGRGVRASTTPKGG